MNTQRNQSRGSKRGWGILLVLRALLGRSRGGRAHTLILR
jgi:hypothetical protein